MATAGTRERLMGEADRIALRDLGWNWGEAYDINGADGSWTASRRDNGRLLAAPDPKELHGLIVADYSAQPVAGGEP
jgi:hypothetical protein